jgi:hypothetical protein
MLSGTSILRQMAWRSVISSRCTAVRCTVATSAAMLAPSVTLVATEEEQGALGNTVESSDDGYRPRAGSSGDRAADF